MVQMWLYKDDGTDQRQPHRGEDVSLADLNKAGIQYQYLSPKDYELELAKFQAENGYNYSDVCTINEEKLPNYNEKIKAFFEEHIHADDEIRYIAEGSGYFDIRDLQDRWVRIKVESGDLLIVPAGIYHRFTVDTNDYIKAVRLFAGVPVWTPINRPADYHPARKAYTQSLAA